MADVQAMPAIRNFHVFRAMISAAANCTITAQLVHIHFPHPHAPSRPM